MPAVYGGPLTTFEDSEKESEYGYVRKVRSIDYYHFVFHHLIQFCFDCLLSDFSICYVASYVIEFM